jgi:CheY-like chemotaxis protein
MIVENPTILLVDDCHDAALLMATVFDRAGLGQPLRFARDGNEGIGYLRGDGIYADRQKFPLPTVLLLDLNMPGKDGFEVLAWIGLQSRLRYLRVYVLSASSQPEDIQRAYDLGASAYLVKPGNLNGLMLLAQSLIAWLKLCHFPEIKGSDEERSSAIHAARSNSRLNEFVH